MATQLQLIQGCFTFESWETRASCHTLAHTWTSATYWFQLYKNKMIVSNQTKCIGETNQRAPQWSRRRSGAALSERSLREAHSSASPEWQHEQEPAQTTTLIKTPHVFVTALCLRMACRRLDIPWLLVAEIAVPNAQRSTSWL